MVFFRFGHSSMILAGFLELGREREEREKEEKRKKESERLI